MWHERFPYPELHSHGSARLAHARCGAVLTWAVIVTSGAMRVTTPPFAGSLEALKSSVTPRMHLMTLLQNATPTTRETRCSNGS